jgi:hypothetical protein
LAFIGGMFNIIDRATTFTLHQPDTVIDYLPTGGTTSNFPDVFILTGIIGYAVLYITLSIIKMVQDKKTKNGTSVHDKNKS